MSGLILVLLSKTRESCSTDGGGLFSVDCGAERQIKKSLSSSDQAVKRSSALDTAANEIAALVGGFVGS